MHTCLAVIITVQLHFTGNQYCKSHNLVHNNNKLQDSNWQPHGYKPPSAFSTLHLKTDDEQRKFEGDSGEFYWLRIKVV